MQTVDHHIADKDDFTRRFALATQYFIRIARRREQQIGQPISHEPVDFLGHRSVIATKSCFDMCQRQAEFRGDETRCRGRIHVAVNDDPIWHLLREHGLDSLHDPSGLHGVRRRAYGQIDIRCTDTEIAKERRRETFVVVLPGVHHELIESSSTSRAMDRRQFWKVGTSADDVQ